MTLRVEPIAPTVDAAPGETVLVSLSVTNDASDPVTLLATPVGLGDAAAIGLADQRFDLSPGTHSVISVLVNVPMTHGIGQHAEAISVRQAGADEARLVRFTLSIASVQRVLLTPTPSPVRGGRSARFDLTIVNNETHSVEFTLESVGEGTRVRYRDPMLRLGPGQHAITSGRVSRRPQWFGESVVHHVQLVARGRAQSSTAALPFVQRPLIANRFRGAVAGLVVVALWLSLAGVGLWWMRQRGDSDVSAPSDPIAAVDQDAGGDGGSSDGTSGDATDGGASDGSSDGTSGDGSSGDGAGGDSSSGDGSSGDGAGGDGSGGDGAGGDGTSGDGSSADGTSGDGSGSGGDGTSGDGSAADGTSGDGSGDDPIAGADDSPSTDDPAPEATPTNIVRGTVDVDGGVADVVITPTPMSLQDVADSPASAFALAERSTAMKIWSARYVPPAATDSVPSTMAVSAGPFAPGSDGIWGIALPINQTYELAFRKPGYEPQSYVVTPKSGARVEVDVTLEPAAGVMSGVVNGGGGRLENVEVLVTDGYFDYRTVTDENGAWGVTGVSSSPGYTVVATLEGYGTDATIVAVEPGAEVTGVTLNLRTGRSVLAGSVVDASTGEPLGGATVTAVNGSSTSTTTSLTDGDVGAFQIPQLVVGDRYSVTAELSGYRTATATAIMQGGLTSIGALRLEPLAATISGSVVDSSTGEPIGSASVVLTRDDLDAPVASVQTVNEGGDGTFVLGRVSPGQYLVTVEHWRHATVRHTLVVESASSSTLDPDDPLGSQSGPVFQFAMDPVDIGVIGDRPTGALSLRVRDADESRECPLGKDGQPRPPEQCSAIFDVTVEITTNDPVFVERAERGEGPFEARVETVVDPLTGLSEERTIYVLRCEPDGECNSGDDFPDYTIRNIPIGSYSVRLKHPDYNPRTISVTIRPGGTTAETVNLARLGTVIGTVVDASQLPLEVSILNQLTVPVLIRNALAPSVVYQTRIIDGTFQTDDETLLPPGRYLVEVDAFGAGFWVDPTQDIDADVTTVGLEFNIPIPDPDNPSGRTVLEPILADPFPAVTVRVAMPTGITPVTFGEINVPPAGGISCASEDGTVVDGTVTGSTISFTKVDIARLDTTRDGVLSTCNLTVSAGGFENGLYTFGGPNAIGQNVASLELSNDRYIDLALLRVATDIIRQPSGTLEWTDPGSGSVPIAGATITASNVITALLPSDSDTLGAPAQYGVTTYAPTLAPVTSALDGSSPPQAVWAFDAAVRQLVGEAAFRIDATGYPGGILYVAIDEAGDMTTRVEMAGDIANTDNLVDERFEVTLTPSDGTLQGQIAVRTSDPTLDPTLFDAASTLPGETPIDFTVAADLSYSAAAAAGTWTTTITAGAGHDIAAAPTEQLGACLPPGVAPPGGPTQTASTAVFRQCVPPGGPSVASVTTAVELGTLQINVLDLDGNLIDSATTPMDVRVDGAAAVASGGGYLATELSVPSGFDPINHPAPPSPPAFIPSTQQTAHNFSIVDAASYDPTQATIRFYRYYRADPSARVLVATLSSYDLTGTTVALPQLGFEPGAKYSVDVTLPSYGAVSGTIVGRDGDGNAVPICGTPEDPTNTATVTAVPVRLDLGAFTSPLDTFDDTWVLDTSGNRSNISTQTCGDFTIVGPNGEYAIVVEHPQFESERSAITGPIPWNPGADGVISVPNTSGAANPTPVAYTGWLPDLEPIRQASIDITAVDALGGAVSPNAYVVVRDVNDAVVAGPSAVVAGADVTLDPENGYVVEVRGCASAPATVADFNACLDRFPVEITVDLPRTTSPTPIVGAYAEVTLLQVGGTIGLDAVFENSRDRAACPVGSFTIDRTFTDDILGVVNTTSTVVLGVDGALRDESLSVTWPDDDQAACATASGTRHIDFVDMIPSGGHQLTAPLITGFGTPTLTWDPDTSDANAATTISGTVGASSVTFDITVSSITATTLATLRYEALPITVTLDICGENSGTAKCNEQFPTLTASLAEPGGGSSRPGTVGTRDNSTGYPVTFTNVIPDAEVHELSITDDLHENAPNQNVLVPPGADLDFADPFLFSGSSVRLAFRFLALNSLGGTPTTTSPTVALFGRDKNDTAWTELSITSVACTIDGQTYQCYDDDVYDEYRIEVLREGYLAESHEYLNLKKGDTVVDTVTIIKLAKVRVTARAYDSADQPVAFPSSLDPLVTLVATAGGGTITAIPASVSCDPRAGCFEWYVDPGGYTDPDDTTAVGTRTYQAQTGSNSSYLSDTSSEVSPSIGETPSAGFLDFHPRIIDVALDIASGVTISGVDLTIDGETYSDNSGPTYRFTSLDANPIPVTSADDGTVLVRASNGRNVAATTPASGTSITVLGYQTVTGTVSAGIPTGTTVTATSGTTTRTTTVVRANAGDTGTFTFSGSQGLDVNDDGSDRAWTITLDDANTTVATVTVDSSTATTLTIADPLTTTTTTTTAPPTTAPPTTAPPTTLPVSSSSSSVPPSTSAPPTTAAPALTNAAPATTNAITPAPPTGTTIAP